MPNNEEEEEEQEEEEEEEEEEEGGFCMGFASIFFSSLTGQRPAPLTTILYQPATSPENFFSAILDGESFDLDLGSTSFSGQVHLTFNEDMSRATVLFLSLQTQLNALLPIVITLPAGERPELAFDEANQILEPLDDQGIDVELSTPLGRQKIAAYLQVFYDSFGNAKVNVQIETQLPNLFADGFESGDASSWTTP